MSSPSGFGGGGPRDNRSKMEQFKDRASSQAHKMGSALDDASKKLGSKGQLHYFGEAGGQPFLLDDVKRLLEERSDRDKLDGMKRAIAMISKGEDASPLFAYVVKNVISKNIELKKLVHIYLVHYAELEPDNALMAINTIQKDLNQPNQFVRASALRVLSSIRLKIILQIVLMAIQKAVKDISPFVRKTAAHAIAKVYDLEPELKDELVPSLEILLGDQSTMVLGSAIACWQEMCPDEFDLIHPHYRKIVHVIADIDEWGQVIALQMLLRYGRTQFADPNREGSEKSDAEKEENGNDEGSDSDLEGWNTTAIGSSGSLDPDHRMLLDNTVQLLRSRNSSVVLGVSTLFYYLAPEPEAQKCAKALTRIMRSDRETQFVVLANIATMATQRPGMFEPVVSEFFVKPYDPSYARGLNLEILTHVVSSNTISKVLRELMGYVTRHGDDSDFVTASIRAIGRCAAQVPSVADRCLHGLMSLLGSKNPAVVAESVIVIKSLLQRIAHKQETPLGSNIAEDDDESPLGRAEVDLTQAITHVSKLLASVSEPQARASIVWLIGEYANHVPLVAPDVLRVLAKSFADEDAAVKLQILNLGAKLHLSLEGQDAAAIVRKLFQYVLSLSKYDMSYDVRDRARLMRRLLFGELTVLGVSAERLFKTAKPLPADVSPGDSRLRFTLNTLSHLLSSTAVGYEPLPDFPEPGAEPDPSTRDVYDANAHTEQEFDDQEFDAEDDFYWDAEEDEYYEEGNEYEEGGDFYGEDDGFYEEAEQGEEEEEDLDGFFDVDQQESSEAAVLNQPEEVEEDVDAFFDDAF